MNTEQENNQQQTIDNSITEQPTKETKKESKEWLTKLQICSEE